MMKINLKMKLGFSPLLLLFVYAVAFGQGKEFKYRTAIQKIDSSDVYKIELQPSLIAKCVEKGLYDIRLIDGHGKYVAYTVVDGQVTKTRTPYINFPGVSTNSTADTATVYIAENKQRLKIDRLWLKMKNTAVDRLVNLEGSDDLHQWFAIKENINLQPAGEESQSEYEQLLTFPTSNYRYFKILVGGKNKIPVKILQSGVYVNGTAELEYSVVPPPVFRIKKIDKATQIDVRFDEPYLVNKIHLGITGPVFYSRKAAVYDLDAGSAILAEDVLISSSGTQDISISAKTSRLRIVISNGDDNPLAVGSVKAYQQKKFAEAYLERGQNYYLLAGDSSAREVSYDLSFLSAKPSSAVRIISHSEVTKNPAYATNVFTVKRDYTQLIWVSIAVVLILLSGLTWRMVKELGTK